MPGPMAPTVSSPTTTLAEATRWINAIKAALRMRPRRYRETASRDDVGNELRPQPGDLVLEDELALLEAAQLQLVLRRIARQARDDVVEVVVLELELVQAHADSLLLGVERRK